MTDSRADKPVGAAATSYSEEPFGDGGVGTEGVGTFKEAVRSNRQIDIAVGMIMAHRRLTADEATKVLRDLSRIRRMRLEELAEELIEHQAELRNERPAGPGSASDSTTEEANTRGRMAGRSAPGLRWWR